MTEGQNAQRPILVCGATGSQGGAVARSLLERGFRIRALTRDTQKPEAETLAKLGAEVVQGDMDDRSSVDRALEGASGVFSVQNFWEAGYDREVRQGKTVADAASAAGVDTSSTARSAAPIGKPGSPTSTASGRSRSTCADWVCPTRS